MLIYNQDKTHLHLYNKTQMAHQQKKHKRLLRRVQLRMEWDPVANLESNLSSKNNLNQFKQNQLLLLNKSLSLEIHLKKLEWDQVVCMVNNLNSKMQ